MSSIAAKKARIKKTETTRITAHFGISNCNDETER